MEIYHARWIVPVDSPPIEDGCIAIEAGAITYVGPHDAAPMPDTVSPVVHDLGDQILLPGFVNAHTHLELTCYHQKIPRGSLWPWLGQIVELCRTPGAEAEQHEALRIGARESLASGVTCVADISRTGANVEVLKQFPLRKVCYVELITGARLPPNDAKSLAEVYEQLEPLSEPDRLRLGISPHAPYSVSVQDLIDVINWASKRRVPLTMHVLESAEEAAWLNGQADGISPAILRSEWQCRHGKSFLTWLSDTPVATLRPLLAHLNYATDDDLRCLTELHANVVYCPRAHHYFGHPLHRWQDMLSAGVNVCIGTDSKASNDSLSILDELRFVRRRSLLFSPMLLLEMGTIRSATAIGFADVIGSLSAGKRADFVAIPFDRNGSADPICNLLDSSEIPSGVWIDGVSVVSDGQLCL